MAGAEVAARISSPQMGTVGRRVRRDSTAGVVEQRGWPVQARPSATCMLRVQCNRRENLKEIVA